MIKPRELGDETTTRCRLVATGLLSCALLLAYVPDVILMLLRRGRTTRP